jgi:hypothetical protein
MALISLQKKVMHLKAIRANKKRYLAQLGKDFANIKSIGERLDLKMPSAGLPSYLKNKVSHKKKEKKVVEKPNKAKQVEIDSDTSDLDEQLLAIREKLNSLGVG